LPWEYYGSEQTHNSERSHIIEKAYQVLLSLHDNERRASIEGFNVILASIAFRGEAENSIQFLDDMRFYGVTPNIDSYTYTLEALGRYVARHNHFQQRKRDRNVLQKHIQWADDCITAIESHRLVPSDHFIRAYAAFLSSVGELDTANNVILDSIRSGISVSDQTIYLLATRNIEMNNIFGAKALASLLEDSDPVLARKISDVERLVIE
jgi:hypothetical protein